MSSCISYNTMLTGHVLVVISGDDRKVRVLPKKFVLVSDTGSMHSCHFCPCQFFKITSSKTTYCTGL